jgi:hypothetical protein
MHDFLDVPTRKVAATFRPTLTSESTKTVKLSDTYREVARQLKVSPAHLFLVANGKRESESLSRRLKPFIVSE